MKSIDEITVVDNAQWNQLFYVIYHYLLMFVAIILPIGVLHFRNVEVNRSNI